MDTRAPENHHLFENMHAWAEAEGGSRTAGSRTATASGAGGGINSDRSAGGAEGREGREGEREWAGGMGLLRADEGLLQVHRILMNPLVAYDWCDFYYGNEVGRWISHRAFCGGVAGEEEEEEEEACVDELGNRKLPPPTSCQPLASDGGSEVELLDVLYVQVSKAHALSSHIT